MTAPTMTAGTATVVLAEYDADLPYDSQVPYDGSPGTMTGGSA